MSIERESALIFKALSDENRIRILKALRPGEKCACELLEILNISQPTLSHHMKILCDAQLVAGRKDGKWMHYTICCEGACRTRRLMRSLLSPENMPHNCSCGGECTCGKEKLC